ncbi:hypothetical protein KIF24_21870 [Micromonospora sp. Llam7]|nr:hypothetical protein [Micromonospora tarapacensis]
MGQAHPQCPDRPADVRGGARSLAEVRRRAGARVFLAGWRARPFVPPRGDAPRRRLA